MSTGDDESTAETFKLRLRKYIWRFGGAAHGGEAGGREIRPGGRFIYLQRADGPIVCTYATNYCRIALRM